MSKKLKIKKRKQVKNQPLVSVVMPAYNANGYIRAAVDSILAQTYKNIEFIIVNDASTDETPQVLKAYAKQYPQIKVLNNKIRLGGPKSAARAMKHAKGEYIARMDADDITLPQRLEKQVEYLERNKETVALGGQCYLIDKTEKIIGIKHFPTDFEQIKKYIFKFCPAQQPALMIAHKRLPKNFDFYGHGMAPVEDVELFFKLFQHGKVENLPDYVLKYRIHGENNSLRNFKKSFVLTLVSRIRGLLKYGFRPTAGGVVISIMQTGVVLVFPRSVSLFIYKMIRKAAMADNLPLVSLRRLLFPQKALETNYVVS